MIRKAYRLEALRVLRSAEVSKGLRELADAAKLVSTSEQGYEQAAATLHGCEARLVGERTAARFASELGALRASDLSGAANFELRTHGEREGLCQDLLRAESILTQAKLEEQGKREALGRHRARRDRIEEHRAQFERTQTLAVDETREDEWTTGRQVSAR